MIINNEYILVFTKNLHQDVLFNTIHPSPPQGKKKTLDSISTQKCELLGNKKNEEKDKQMRYIPSCKYFLC